MANDVDPRFKANPQLEEEVKKMTNSEMHPLVTKIQQRFGMFNLIRNSRNQKQIEIEEAGKQG